MIMPRGGRKGRQGMGTTPPKGRRQGRAGLGDDGKAFVRCALDPFASDSARVPTGTAQRTMHVKYTCMVSGKPRAGQTTMSVAMLPGLPGSLRLIDGTFTAPDRSGSVGSFDVLPNNAIITVPFSDFYTPSGAASLLPNQPTALATARIVGYGLEVRASATIINQGGAAVTAKVPIVLPEIYLPAVVPIGPYAGVSTTGTGTQLARNYSGLPGSFAVLQQYPDTKMCSGTDSCRLVGEVDDYEPFTSVFHQGADQTIVRTFGTYVPNTQILVTGTTTTAAGGVLNPSEVMVCKPLTGDSHLVGDFWSPTGAQALCWAADSLTTDSLYEFKVVLCIEATVEHVGSSIYRPFVSRAPPQNERALAMARRALQAMPASLPPPDRSTGSWWSILSEAVTGFGDIIGGLDLPVVSGVARTATRLARMLM